MYLFNRAYKTSYTSDLSIYMVKKNSMRFSKLAKHLRFFLLSKKINDHTSKQHLPRYNLKPPSEQIKTN